MADMLRVPSSTADVPVGALIAGALEEAIALRGFGRLAISGGSAASAVCKVRETMGELWSLVRLTWIDERCVPTDDPMSNRGEAYRAGYLSADQAAQIELPLWLDDDDDERAVARVQKSLDTSFDNGLDVTLLGMGPDGHIASLFAGHALLNHPPERSVATLWDSPKPPPHRITLTLAFLQRCPRHILLALGSEKQPAIEATLASDPAFPASKLANLTIVTDNGLKEAGL